MAVLVAAVLLAAPIYVTPCLEHPTCETPPPEPEPKEVKADSPPPTPPISPDTTSVAAQPPPPTPVNVPSGVEQWRSLVAAYFPADQVDFALCVMNGESGGDPNAYNPSSASGLMQVLANLWAPEYGIDPQELFDPDTNLRIAADIWANYGWDAWSASGGC